MFPRRFAKYEFRSGATVHLTTTNSSISSFHPSLTIGFVFEHDSGLTDILSLSIILRQHHVVPHSGGTDMPDAHGTAHAADTHDGAQMLHQHPVVIHHHLADAAQGGPPGAAQPHIIEENSSIRVPYAGFAFLAFLVTMMGNVFAQSL